MMRAWCAVVCAALAAGVTSAAGAEPDLARVRFEYRAAPGCPPEAELVRQVQMRTRRARIARAGESARLFVVQIGEGTPARGSLGVREADGSENRRDVSAKDCVEVVSALALVIALVIDPNASTEPLPAAPAPEPPAPAPEPAAPVMPGAALPASEVRWQWAAGASFGATSAIAPELAPELALFLQTALDEGDGWQPMVRLTGAVARSFEIDTAAGAARFTRWMAKVSLSPVRVPAAHALAFRPAVFAELGALTGAGIDTEQPASATVLWLAGGLSASAEVAAGDWLLAGLEVDAILPAIRDRFYFSPRGGWEHRVPVLAAGGALWLGVRFP